MIAIMGVLKPVMIINNGCGKDSYDDQQWVW